MPPSQRRAAIVEAIVPLLIESGASVTSRQLAAAAGVSEGTIFNVFADKDELISAAVERAIDPAPFERAIGEIDTSAPFVDQLTEATEIIQRRIVDIWALISRVGPHHRPERHPLPDSPALAALLGSDRERLRMEPASAARLLRALTLSSTHPMMTAEPRPAADIVDVFLNGVANTDRGAT